jgi:hypothetical protein
VLGRPIRPALHKTNRKADDQNAEPSDQEDKGNGHERGDSPARDNHE